MMMFKDTVVDLGDIPIGSKHDVFWEFDELTKEHIPIDKETNQPAIKTSCGCTLPAVTEEGISARYNDGGNSTGAFTKTVTVYLKEPDDDTPLKVKGAKGYVYNDSLSKVVLTITGNRVLKS